MARRSNDGCMGVARRLREVRNAKGLSQAEIGKRVGLAHTYISRVENGRITPTLPLLERLAKGLEIDAYQLFLFGHEKTQSSKPLRLVPDGAQERSLLEVFREISREDRSLLLYMARQMAGRPEGASKEVGENHDAQARPTESGQDAAGPTVTIPPSPDGTSPARRVSGRRASVAAPEWATQAGEEVEAGVPV